MVAAAIVSQQSSDLHRRAEVMAEEIRASSQEMSTFKWRTNTEVLTGTANLSESGALVSDGTRILSQLSTETAQLVKLQGGRDSDRLARDVQELLAASLQALSAARNPGARSLAQIQDQFQPILDRMDNNAQQAAQHQQAVAAEAISRSLWSSIASVVLGVGLLGVLGWRLAILQRRNAVAEQTRAIERRNDQRIRALLEDSSDVVTVLGRDLGVRWQAASVRGLLGVEPGSLIGTQFISLAHPDDQALLESFLGATAAGNPATLGVRLQHAGGRWLHVEIVAKERFSDPAIGGLVLNIRDISQRLAMEEELRHQAFHDALTGLANRALFENRLRHALAAGLRTRRPLVVLFIDLDDFKMINDSLGHAAGDLLLQNVAARIDPLLRPTDTAARLGGDEFAVLLDGVGNIDDAHAIAGRIRDALSDGFRIDNRKLQITASIGIALSDGSVQAAELLRNADTAMYAAKSSGKNSVRRFEAAMHDAVLDRLELRARLSRAIEHNELRLQYQPIVALQTSAIVGVEALVRWQHPSHGLLAPAQFIGPAEETGQIVALGRWVLEQACVQARAWERVHPRDRPMFVSVNVSTRQLGQDDFPDTVAQILARSGLAARSLVLEITEGMLADDREAIIARLHRLKALGLRIAVDDFGTGYSALSHLQQFPIDILKIDKSFIDELHTDNQKASLVQGIINLGESMHLDVITEGIEQAEQAARLRAMRSPLGQGFLFSRPIDPDAILALLRNDGNQAAAVDDAGDVAGSQQHPPIG